MLAEGEARGRHLARGRHIGIRSLLTRARVQVPTPSEAPNGQRIPIQVASTTDMPVGGGTVILKDTIVVTQPTAGEFKALSAVCPHVGCLLDKVANATIDCPCHGSTFRMSDGSVVTGPATRPLTPAPITVAHGVITIV